jgi:hypothetical protein
MEGTGPAAMRGSFLTSVSDMPTCSLNPTSVTVSGAAAQTSPLTVNTPAASSAKCRGDATSQIHYSAEPVRPRHANRSGIPGSRARVTVKDVVPPDPGATPGSAVMLRSTVENRKRSLFWSSAFFRSLR